MARYVSSCFAAPCERKFDRSIRPVRFVLCESSFPRGFAATSSSRALSLRSRSFRLGMARMAPTAAVRVSERSSETPPRCSPHSRRVCSPRHISSVEMMANTPSASRRTLRPRCCTHRRVRRRERRRTPAPVGSKVAYTRWRNALRRCSFQYAHRPRHLQQLLLMEHPQLGAGWLRGRG